MLWSIIFSTFGGLGLFLFGMQMMASGMQKAAGDRFRRILEVLTNKPLIGILTGTLVTVLIQSSGTSTVMVVGFANAGLMSLSQAISVIIGANIGTTVTAQIVSFKIGIVALPAIGIGSLLNFFGKRKLHRYFGQLILGFGLLFLGITIMADGMIPLRELESFQKLLTQFSHRPILGVLFGLLFTAVVQSSSASIGVIIALTMKDLITFQAAVPLVLGANVGSVIITILASFGANITARRSAVAHLMFNVFGVILAFILLEPFTELMMKTAVSVPRQVANAHTLFNMINAGLFLVFFKPFIALVCKIIPGTDKTMEFGPKYLDPRILMTPAMAIGGAKKEVLRMAVIAREMLAEAMQVFLKDDLKKIPHIEQMESLVDSLEKEVNTYLAELSQHSMSKEQSQTVANLMSAANDFERIADHAENIMQLSEIKVEEKRPFSPVAIEELTRFYKMVDNMVEKAIQAFETDDLQMAKEIISEDYKVDEQEAMLRNLHIDRINTKKCYPTAGVIYLDLLSNLERVGDHASNIAGLVIA